MPLVKRPLATLERDYRLPPYAAQAAAYAEQVGGDALDRHYTGPRATLARIRHRLAVRARADDDGDEDAQATRERVAF